VRILGAPFGKTVGGAAIWAGGVIFQALAGGQGGEKAAIIAQGVGGLLAMLGVRHAILKTQQGGF
jgi:hypothetical protein